MYSSFNARAVGLPGLSTAATIDAAADAGFDAVDLMVRDLVRSGADLAAVRSRMDRRGLRAGAFPMTMDWRGDESAFRRDLVELATCARAAAALGLTRTGTWVMPETPKPPPTGVDPAAYRAEVASFHTDRLAAIARVLADHGIRLGLEVIGVATFRRGVGVPFVHRLRDLAPTIPGLVDVPNVGLLVDAFHLHAADEPPAEALGWGVDRVVWAHVADLPPGPAPERDAIVDAERGLPGANGGVDCRAFLAMLAVAGYDGPVTAEPLAHCAALLDRQPGEVARRVKESLEACWPGPTRPREEADQTPSAARSTEVPSESPRAGEISSR